MGLALALGMAGSSGNAAVMFILVDQNGATLTNAAGEALYAG